MKKLTAMLLAICLALIGAAALGEAVAADAGRLSVSVPDEWNANPVGETQIILTQEENDGFVSITYYPVGTMFFDIRDFYQDVEDLEPLTLGDYTWNGYNVNDPGMEYTNATAESADGTLFLTMVRTEEMTIENANVQAILSSVKVVPTVEADWFSISEDGTLTVTLQETNEYAWQEGGAAYSTPENDTDSPEADLEFSLENDVCTAKLKVGTGEWYTQYFTPGNETSVAGQAYVTVKIADGKIVAATNAVQEIYPEPQIFDMNYEDEGYSAEGQELDFYFNGTTWESGELKMEAVYQDGYYKVVILDGDKELSYLCDTGVASGWKIAIGTGAEDLDAEQADRGLAVFHIDDEGNMVWKRATGEDVIFTWYSEAN